MTIKKFTTALRLLGATSTATSFPEETQYFFPCISDSIIISDLGWIKLVDSEGYRYSLLTIDEVKMPQRFGCGISIESTRPHKVNYLF